MSPRWPDAAAAAFGLTGRPHRLAGGQGRSVRVGHGVLKPVEDADAARELAELSLRVRQDGFRLPRPLRAHDGGWVVDGWCAHELLDGRTGPAGHWDELFAATRAFTQALADERPPAFLQRRTDGWALADRVAWGEGVVVPVPPVRPLLEALLAQLAPDSGRPRQLVHGDLCGNVLFADGRPPVILDLSLYWRPAAYAEAVAAVDGLLWHPPGPDTVRLVAAGGLSRDDLRRALVFRLAALGEQARDAPAVLAELPQFTAVARRLA